MTDPESDLLRSANCPACGYDLTGLPRHGTCPECGQAFDQHHLDRTGIHNTHRYQRGDWLMRRLRTLVLAGVAGVCLICAGTVQFNSGAAGIVGSAVLIAGIFTLAAVTSFLYESEP